MTASPAPVQHETLEAPDHRPGVGVRNTQPPPAFHLSHVLLFLGLCVLSTSPHMAANVTCVSTGHVEGNMGDTEDGNASKPLCLPCRLCELTEHELYKF